MLILQGDEKNVAGPVAISIITADSETCSLSIDTWPQLVLSTAFWIDSPSSVLARPRFPPSLVDLTDSRRSLRFPLLSESPVRIGRGSSVAAERTSLDPWRSQVSVKVVETY